MFLQHHAHASAPAASKETARQAVLRKRGDSRASVLEVAGPDYDHSVHYLRVIASELYGRSGLSPNGDVLPLAPSELLAWEEATGTFLAPHEFHAVLQCDTAMRSRPVEVEQ